MNWRARPSVAPRRRDGSARRDRQAPPRAQGRRVARAVELDLLHDARIGWVRGDPLDAGEIERIQAPLRALGDWYISPGERFKRYDADSLEGRVELRPRH